jgi:hypothetical protein
VQQHRTRVGSPQPGDDVGVELVDAPTGVALVVVVTEAGRPVEPGADEVDCVAATGQPLPQVDPVPTGHVEPVGDRVAEWHDAYTTVRLGLGGCDLDQRQHSAEDEPEGPGGGPSCVPSHC